MKISMVRSFIFTMLLLAIIALPVPVFAAEDSSFWERLAHNYGDPKNWLIGAGIGLAFGIIVMLGKKKK